MKLKNKVMAGYNRNPSDLMAVARILFELGEIDLQTHAHILRLCTESKIQDAYDVMVNK